MSYPYGGGGDPGQGQTGYPGQGFPQPGGGYPQQGYGAPQPGVGMPTPESASAAAYGSRPGGMPYCTAPPGGAPGGLGFGMQGGPPQPDYPQAPNVSMPASPGAGQPTYQQNMGYGQKPAYNTPVPQPGYNPPVGAPGYPASGAWRTRISTGRWSPRIPSGRGSPQISTSRWCPRLPTGRGSPRLPRTGTRASTWSSTSRRL